VINTTVGWVVDWALILFDRASASWSDSNMEHVCIECVKKLGEHSSPNLWTPTMLAEHKVDFSLSFRVSYI
jgi:hypothetical protein